MKFVSSAMKVQEPEIVLTPKRGRGASAHIKYPAPNPKDWADEEYEEDTQDEDNS